MANEVFSRCGMRCDLCLIYRPNVEADDRREAICSVFAKAFPGYEAVPTEIICDGCLCEREDAVLFDPACQARRCVRKKGLRFCGDCDQYPCDIFPAEPTQEELRQKIDIEKRWTWAEEELMKAYSCKKHMDEYRKSKNESE